MYFYSRRDTRAARSIVHHAAAVTAGFLVQQVGPSGLTLAPQGIMARMFKNSRTPRQDWTPKRPTSLTKAPFVG